MLAAIDAPHFYAGIVLESDIVIEAAPIVKYMKEWLRDKVLLLPAEGLESDRRLEMFGNEQYRKTAHDRDTVL